MSEAVKLTCTTCGQLNRVPLARLADKPKCGQCGDPLVTGTVAELDLRTHDKATRTDELPLLVDYWAPGAVPAAPWPRSSPAPPPALLRWPASQRSTPKITPRFRAAWASGAYRC